MYFFIKTQQYRSREYLIKEYLKGFIKPLKACPGKWSEVEVVIILF